jgi:hypothetical protein
MPGQLFIYYIANPLVTISINTGSLERVMVIRLVIDFGELVKVALRRGGEKRSGWVGEFLRVLLCFVALVCVLVCFCCSGGCLCQGLQGAGIVCSW